MSAAPVLFTDSFGVRRGSRNDQESSPYPWFIPPPGSVSVFEHGSFPTPAYGTQITLATYIVPDGWEGVLTDVMVFLLDPNGTFVQGSGSALWDIDIDRPLGSALATGRFLPNYFHIPTQLGDLTRPWPVRGGWRMKQGETYRIKFTSVNTITVGSPAFTHGALLGWVWPMAR